MSRRYSELLIDFNYLLDDHIDYVPETDEVEVRLMNVTYIVADINDRIEWLTVRLERYPDDIEYKLRYQAEIRLLCTLKNTAWAVAEEIEDILERS